MRVRLLQLHGKWFGIFFLNTLPPLSLSCLVFIMVHVQCAWCTHFNKRAYVLLFLMIFGDKIHGNEYDAIQNNRTINIFLTYLQHIHYSGRIN